VPIAEISVNQDDPAEVEEGQAKDGDLGEQPRPRSRLIASPAMTIVITGYAGRKAE